MRVQPLSWMMLCLVFMVPLPSMSQSAIPYPQNPSLSQTPSRTDESRAKMEREMAKKANQMRHADLKRDTERLFKLATELKEYVGESNENMLSVNVVKKAEEIEKLAHSVKEKMKGN